MIDLISDVFSSIGNSTIVCIVGGRLLEVIIFAACRDLLFIRNMLQY